MLLIPYRSKNPPESFPIITILLLLANVLAYALTSDGWSIDPYIAFEYGVSYEHTTLVNLFAHMFLHGDWFHLATNLLFLYLFGFAVEGRLKWYRFLPLYLVSGLIGAGAQIVLAGQVAPDMPMVGASGAIAGLMGAALYMFPFAQINFFALIIVIPRLFIWPMWVVAVLSILSDFIGMFSLDQSVAHLAHLGGVLGGVIMCWIYRAKRDSAMASEAKAMLADTRDLRYLSRLELESMVESNPKDTTLVLNLIHRSIRDNRVSSECQKAFLDLLPAILQKEPIQSVGFVLGHLAATPGTLASSVSLDAAGRLEGAGDNMAALRLYEHVLRDAACDPADFEAAMFRLALLCETKFANQPRAAAGYQKVLEKYPMGAFAGQARLRLEALQKRNRT